MHILQSEFIKKFLGPFVDNIDIKIKLTKWCYTLTICKPLDTSSGVYEPFCIPFIDDVAVDPPLITGVNCCHVEPCELEDGWSECCCACDVSGGGEFTGVDGLLKLLILWSADVYIVCIAFPTIVSFCIAGLCCECRCGCGWGLYNAGEFWPCGPVGGTGCVALPRNVLIGGNVCDWLWKSKKKKIFVFEHNNNAAESSLPVSCDRLYASHPVIRNNDRVHAVDQGVGNGRHDGMMLTLIGVYMRYLVMYTMWQRMNRNMALVGTVFRQLSVMHIERLSQDYHEEIHQNHTVNEKNIKLKLSFY